MATVPLIARVVADTHVLRSRVYKPQSHLQLAAALAGAAAGRFPLLVLFPGEGAQDVSQVAATLQRQQQQQQAAGDADSAAGDADPSYVLLVIDGTWQQVRGCRLPPGWRHDCEGPEAPASRCAALPPLRAPAAAPQAREMFHALSPHVLPPSGPGLRIQLPLPTAAGAAAAVGEQVAAPGGNGSPKLEREEQQLLDARGDLPGARAAGASSHGGAEAAAGAGCQPADDMILLRMEPVPGCLTTCEAVARTLRWLEGPAAGPEVQAALLSPLRLMANHQVGARAGLAPTCFAALPAGHVHADPSPRAAAAGTVGPQRAGAPRRRGVCPLQLQPAAHGRWQAHGAEHCGFPERPDAGCGDLLKGHNLWEK